MAESPRGSALSKDDGEGEKYITPTRMAKEQAIRVQLLSIFTWIHLCQLQF
jgi:hypothetical protein